MAEVGAREIRIDHVFDAPRDAVFSAWIDPDQIARWWAPGDVRAEVGHTFSLDMGPWGRQSCRVLEVQEGRLLRYSFGEGVLDSTVTWRLAPEGSGTRLFLTHDGFDLDSPVGRQAYDGMGTGWPTVLSRITPALTAA